jgi:hypothetical protein
MPVYKTAFAFASMLGACVADVPVDAVGSKLDITALDSNGLDARIRIDGQLFTLSSRLESRPPLVDATDPLADPTSGDELVRTTTLQRANGDTIASFSVAVADGEMTGAISDQPFGRPQDETSDDDAALWATIAGSPDGRVIDALSVAASASLDSGLDASAAPFVADVSHVSAMLHDLAAPPDLDLTTDTLGLGETAAVAATHHITTLGWDFGSGPNRRVFLIPNQSGAIGIHSASNELAIAEKRQSIQDRPDFTLGIREVEPYEYNTSRAYRRMVARVVGQAHAAGTATQPILVMFNTGRYGSHDPMSTLPGLNADNQRNHRAARALRTVLHENPELRFAVELYCAGDMTESQWTSRRARLGHWAAKVGIGRARITIDEDISATTVASGEHYGALGNIGHFNAMLAIEADHVFHGGWGGIDYVSSPPTGAYPTHTSTYDVVHQIMSTY